MHTLKQLKSGQLDGIKRLSLSEQLSAFPSEILSLADSLEILDLSNNSLCSLPDEIASLHKLKILFASNNHFTVLPEVLGQLPNLEMIGFKSNQIEQVPHNSLPPKLRWLILTDNKITSLPDSLGERPRLQKLALAGNRLTSLPQTLSQCHNLELIRISANQLSHCPDQLLKLPKLAWFAFAGNPFSQSSKTITSVPNVKSTDFELGDILGHGASGVIYKAKWKTTQTSFREDIAVKVFKGQITSDGYPSDELRACLKTGSHPNLVASIAQVDEKDCRALIMSLIPENYRNLGLPPSFASCTRDTFETGQSLSQQQADKIITQMQAVFNYLHDNQVCHGDLYAHNTLYDDQANIIFGDFGAASIYDMLNTQQQACIRTIEARSLAHFIDDIQGLCKA